MQCVWIWCNATRLIIREEVSINKFCRTVHVFPLCIVTSGLICQHDTPRMQCESSAVLEHKYSMIRGRERSLYICNSRASAIARGRLVWQARCVWTWCHASRLDVLRRSLCQQFFLNCARVSTVRSCSLQSVPLTNHSASSVNQCSSCAHGISCKFTRT